MKLSLCLFAVTALFLAGCGDSSKSSNNSTSPATAAADYGNALSRGQNNALKTVDIASLTQAIQMFNVNEGRYPKDLNELVDAKLISKIPAAPNGMKIAYDATAGKVSMVPE